MATKDEMYNRYARPKRKVSWERVVQGAGSGALEGGTLGAKFGPKGAAIGAAGGALVGGLTGYLSSPKSVDPILYKEMIDRYTKGRRFQARTAANQLSADAGAAFAARGINTQLGAGVITANRGRMMAAAERDINKFKSDIYNSIIQAEYNAEQAENEQIRQGWISLAQDLAFTAGEIVAEREGQGRKSAAAAPGEYVRDIEGTNRDAQFVLDRVNREIPESTYSPEVVANPDRFDPNRPQIDRVSITPSPDSLDPNRPQTAGASPGASPAGEQMITSPSVQALEKALDDESRTMLGTLIPDYPIIIKEMDDLLEAEGIEIPSATGEPTAGSARGTMAWERERSVDNQWTIGPDGQLIELPPDLRIHQEPSTAPDPFFPDRTPDTSPPQPDTSPGRLRKFETDDSDDNIEMPPSRPDHLFPAVPNTTPDTSPYKPITDAFGISDSVIPPKSYAGLPQYYPLILDAEGGMAYNPRDPSVAGVWQTTYNDFLRSAENSSVYPRNVSELSPSNVNDFYQWYHSQTTASIDSEYTPEAVKDLWHFSSVFQYIYSDAAVNHGQAGAAHIASEFARGYAEGEAPETMIRRFTQERKNYIRMLRGNQIKKVERDYDNKEISLRERNKRVRAINNKWTSLSRRASKTSFRANRLVEMEGQR